ncbi:unnamed protein product [Camellia sinensis]
MMVFARSMWLLGLIYFLGLGLVFGLNFGESLKVPFRVNDVLPALPRQISWPVLNNLHSAVDLLPSFVGSVSPTNGSIEWKGACFFDNEARLEFTGGDRGLGGGVLHLKIYGQSWKSTNTVWFFKIMKRLQQPVSSAAKKQTLQWAAWTRQKEESFFTALRQVGKGGNVGHLHKLLGIESSSQGLDHLIHPKLPSFPIPETGAYGLTSYWKSTRVICLPLCNRNLHGFVTSGTVQQVDDKYQYSCDDKDNRVHGWICSNPAVGFWMITPSDEFRTGGPVKQDLTSHVGPTTLSMFFSTHYAGDNQTIKLRDGEPWKKVFGPVLIYLNSVSVEEDALTLWEDAKEQMLIETQSWPYDFPLSKDFPHADQRGTVSG